jgi:hypothetical protein
VVKAKSNDDMAKSVKQTRPEETAADQVAALRLENERLLAELKALQGDTRPRTLGTVTMQLEEVATGKMRDVTFGIRPGFPYVRLKEGIYASQDVVDALNGKQKLEGVSENSLIEQIARAVVIRAGWIEFE